MLLLLLLLLHVVLVVVAPVMAGLRAEAVACAVGGRRHGDGVDVRAATNQLRVKLIPLKISWCFSTHLCILFRPPSAVASSLDAAAAGVAYICILCPVLCTEECGERRP